MADDDGSDAASSSPFLYVEGNQNEDFKVQLYIDDLDSGTGALPFCSLLSTRASR